MRKRGSTKTAGKDSRPDVATTQQRSAPRAPGIRFSDLVRMDTSRTPDPCLLIDKSEWQGDEAIPASRYIGREIHELEKQKIWKKVWQMACREEEIPEVGDAIVYDITDISILVVRAD